MSDPETRPAALPIVEETLTIGTREVDTAHIRVRTIVEEESREAALQLARGDVAIERRQVDRPVDRAPAPFTDADGALIVPIVEERLIVEKRLFVVEELVVRATTRTEDVLVPASVRKMRAVVERRDDLQRKED